MIKKILLALVIALPMCAFAQSPKFGVVDIDPIFTAMPETTAARDQMASASKKYEDEFAKLQEEFNKKYTEWQNLQKETSTPESIKELRLQELNQLNEKMQQFQAAASEDLQRQQQQLYAPIQERIMSAIKSVGQENGFTFIFTNDAPVYVGTDVIDVTSMVKTKLNLK